MLLPQNSCDSDRLCWRVIRISFTSSRLLSNSLDSSLLAKLNQASLGLVTLWRSQSHSVLTRRQFACDIKHSNIWLWLYQRNRSNDSDLKDSIYTLGYIYLSKTKHINWPKDPRTNKTLSIHSPCVTDNHQETSNPHSERALQARGAAPSRFHWYWIWSDLLGRRVASGS